MPLQKPRTVVDANVILRFLLKDNEQLYGIAEDFFESVLKGRRFAYIPEAVIAEVVYVLEKLYKVNRSDISDTLGELLQVKYVKTCKKDTLMKALNIYSSNKIDFVDCLICAYGEDYEVISFDKDVSKCLDLST